MLAMLLLLLLLQSAGNGRSHSRSLIGELSRDIGDKPTLIRVK
jgi:hypothetical protein